MDFVVSRSDFSKALKQILHGRSEESGDVVDLTVDQSTLAVVVTGRSIEVSVEADEIGSASIPIGVMFGLKRLSGAYNDESIRIRIREGKLRFQSTSISNPAITKKRVARRIINIPYEAQPRDILSLPLIFSVDEIEDSGLHGNVLEEQSKFTESLDRAAEILREYGLQRDDVAAMAESRIKEYADKLKRILFSEDPVGELNRQHEAMLKQLAAEVNKDPGWKDAHYVVDLKDNPRAQAINQAIQELREERKKRDDV
jgi:hypothetical protein